MFKLFRRFSSSVFPRNDRPWADDATSTAPTIGTKRRLSSTDMDLEIPPGSLSKKSRRGKATDASDDEEPASSPLTSSSLPPRSSPPPSDVKEVTTGVKEIELGHGPDQSPSDSSEVAELPVTLDVGTSVDSEEVTPEPRPEVQDSLEAEVSQDLVQDDSTDENPAKPEEEPSDDSSETPKSSEEAQKPFIAHPASPAKVSQSNYSVEESVASEDKPEIKA